MKTLIISAFSGTGKTTFFKKYPDISIDCGNTKFKWKRINNNKVIKNPEFPKNYVDAIKENIGKYKYIFVSTHTEVRDILKENDLYFYLIYPAIDRKDEFLQRYRDRNSPESYIKSLDLNWNTWITECSNENNKCLNIQMTTLNLEDEILLF